MGRNQSRKVYFENCHPALFTFARIQNISWIYVLEFNFMRSKGFLNPLIDIWPGTKMNKIIFKKIVKQSAHF